MTAATLWYRGSVIERKSESPLARSCGQGDRGKPRREHEEEQQREPEPDEVREVVASTSAPRTTPGSVKSVRTTPAGEPPTSS